VGHRVILRVIQTNGSRGGDDTVALTHDDLTQLMEMVRAGGDVDVVRESVELVLQALIEAEVTEVIGTGPHERTEARTNQRNGARARLLSTKAGDVELRIPKLRRGSFFPAVLEPASYRPGVVRGGDGGLRARREHPQGRRPRRRAR
jgi:Transposase, Mutator family